jgi:hypothetical protein
VVVAVHLDAIDEEQRDLLPLLVRQARGGLDIPRIALRHRLQRDVHGLDRSRHVMRGAEGRVVVEIDAHGAAIPQVLGAILGAASLPGSGRAIALDAIARVVDGRWLGLVDGVEVYLRHEREPGLAPPLAGVGARVPGGPPEEDAWRGVPPDQRWAMEVLGLRAHTAIARDDVNRRFRRLLRDAHPDHGAPSVGAAARIAELTEARELLLGIASADLAAEG